MSALKLVRWRFLLNSFAKTVPHVNELVLMYGLYLFMVRACSGLRHLSRIESSAMNASKPGRESKQEKDRQARHIVHMPMAHITQMPLTQETTTRI